MSTKVMLQHTRGPWYTNRLGDGYAVYAEVKDNTPDTQPEATVREEANARLIAAAPELLAALETMLEYLLESHASELESCHAGDAELAGEAPEACSYCKGIAEARAIIAKAKGEA